MVGPGVNLATTKDGGTYNKLQRPADYLSLTTNAPQKDAPNVHDMSSTSASKRKREYEDNIKNQKRTRASADRVGGTNSRTGAREIGKPRAADNGMRALLPGLEDDGGSSDEGSMSEALAYLRNVRSEALEIPNLLVAQTTDSHVHEDNDHRVLFREGTYIALGQHHAEVDSNLGSSETPGFPGPQERQAQMLLKRFYALRSTLAVMADSQDLPTTQETSALARSLRRKREWSDLINQESPRLDLVVQLDHAAVYHGLESCAENIDRATSISAHVSCWIWTLLAAVGDVGTLDNDKIDCIRNLGRKAGTLATRLRKGVREPQVKVEGKGDGVCDGSFQAHAEDDLEEGEEREPDDASDGEVACDGYNHDEIQGDADMIETTPNGNLLAEPTSDAEMSISEDEELSEQGEPVSELEQARALLLSQLSDRLVRSQVPSSNAPSTEKRAGRARGRQIREGLKWSSEESDDLADYGVDLNTRSTIDMIWTIMAEHFGQRDFLEFRKLW
ncbi:hypothetical protein DE146DRAFT_786992 [Phaeosphaeria sp. MPI-PUGE-AT-0046c]|nr:hypothetical protein DE146DRAFT_786992 [Phaeosphaeria sp. MPI-PUGE-AT-0046c]